MPKAKQTNPKGTGGGNWDSFLEWLRNLQSPPETRLSGQGWGQIPRKNLPGTRAPITTLPDTASGRSGEFVPLAGLSPTVSSPSISYPGIRKPLGTPGFSYTYQNPASPIAAEPTEPTEPNYRDWYWDQNFGIYRSRTTGEYLASDIAGGAPLVGALNKWGQPVWTRATLMVGGVRGRGSPRRVQSGATPPAGMVRGVRRIRFGAGKKFNEQISGTRRPGGGEEQAVGTPPVPGGGVFGIVSWRP